MRQTLILAVTTTCLAALPLTVYAAERVTLSNGFSMNCDHHALSGSHVRLYLTAGEDDYIEFGAQDVAAVESVPNFSPAPVQQVSAYRPIARAQTPLTQTDLAEMLVRAGHAHNLDVDLLASVVKAESGGNPRAVSPVGARGLMQLMPATAAGLGVENSFIPDQNLRGGSAYLDALLTHYHNNLALALAAYNAGPAAVDRYHGIPPYRETRLYVARVIHEFNRRVLARDTAARLAAR